MYHAPYGLLVRYPFLVEKVHSSALINNPPQFNTGLFPFSHDAFLGSGDRGCGGIPTNQVHSLLFRVSSPDKVPLHPIDDHVHELGFPASMLSIHCIKDELEVIVGGLLVEDGVAEFSPIHKDGNGSAAHTGHAEVGDLWRKIEVEKGISDIGPLNDEFLDNDSIVNTSSIGQEASLVWANDLGEKGFNSVHNDLGDKLVGGVAKTNRGLCPYFLPVSLVEEGVQTIRPRSLGVMALSVGFPISLTLKHGLSMVSSEKLGKVGENVGSDLVMVSHGVPHVILEAKDSISPPFVNGRGMEETGVGIPLTQLVNSGFGFPEFLLHFEESIIVIEKP
ncbi:hypothetical protein KY290_012900 [Solanum tuberosum]|uniref:Uncharacterized protein n=1 Tax=Solanum tuberosum TaxID=4113 RepID=A0ABQ7VK93_SOLTU|nr:hypothetical protein KY285_012655 [Solanum tuberosum]KAH0768919.1 hypothetical protein KY290_012900 [Solanum tuberosum]